jgi:type VI secretion system protein ImpE
MSAEQLLSEGRLDEALAELKQRVRSDAANPKHRIFLFQLLAVVGDWERAYTQLEVAGDLDASALAMVQTYREALRCEVLRAQIFAGKRSPLVFGDPEQWIALLVEALELTAAGEHGKAATLRDDAFGAAPATAGMIDGQRFDWIADADQRLGPLLEAVINGRYYWVPFHRIRTLRVEPPVDLRDLVWMPANFTWANGGETVGLIPTRYPDSEANPDPRVRMARKTEWVEPTPGTYLAQGQRMFATDAGEYPLMDVRLVQLETGEAGRASETADPGPDVTTSGG